MDCSPPVFSVHGILQARILEWLAIPFPRGSSPPGLLLCRQVLYYVNCLLNSSRQCSPGSPGFPGAVLEEVCIPSACVPSTRAQSWPHASASELSKCSLAKFMGRREKSEQLTALLQVDWAIWWVEFAVEERGSGHVQMIEFEKVDLGTYTINENT